MGGDGANLGGEQARPDADVPGAPRHVRHEIADAPHGLDDGDGAAAYGLNHGGKTRPKTEGAQHAAPLLSYTRRRLRREAGERLADVAVAQPLQRAIAQLPDTLTRDTEHTADFFERVLTAAIETEVQPQDL